MWSDGDEEWYQNGLRHREGGPAIETAHGSKHWIRNGKPHREDGPAVITPDGRKVWWIDGVEYSEQEYHTALKTQGRKHDK